jgi:hypothetical protein
MVETAEWHPGFAASGKFAGGKWTGGGGGD